MNEIAEGQDFKTRLKQRIKDSIGDLMTDEELQNLINRGIEEIFFKERIETDYSGYSSRTFSKPPLIEDLIKEYAEPYLREAVREFVKENSEEMQTQLKEFLQTKPAELFLKSFFSIFESDMRNIQATIENRLFNLELGNN